MFARFSVTEYFKGNNWKVHPDWVYCEYSSASEKWFPSPEERVLHFLARTRSPGWKWMSLRPRSPSSHHKQASKPDKDAYYCELSIPPIVSVQDARISLRTYCSYVAQYRACLHTVKSRKDKVKLTLTHRRFYGTGDKRLVQSLVLDALVTDGFDKRGAMHKEENQR